MNDVYQVRGPDEGQRNPGWHDSKVGASKLALTGFWEGKPSFLGGVENLADPFRLLFAPHHSTCCFREKATPGGTMGASEIVDLY